MREHGERGIVPDAWTPTPQWHGEELDLGLALEMLRGTEWRAKEGAQERHTGNGTAA
jgi:hypothetical protein